ncbi:MAG: hypothetical protein ACXIVQ_10660 [Acidimicrobiales bacterium]
MRTVRTLTGTIVAALAIAALLAPPAAAAPDTIAPLPVPDELTATIEVSCTEAVPVPTVTVQVTNTTQAPRLVVIRRNGLSIAAPVVAPGSSQHTHTSVTWEDVDNTFEVADAGAVIAGLDHHFDCLHPVIVASISAPCAGPVMVDVANTGAEGTHVTVTVDGHHIGDLAVAPGAQVVEQVDGAPGQAVEIHHAGSVVAATTVPSCPRPGSLRPAPPRDTLVSLAVAVRGASPRT